MNRITERSLHSTSFFAPSTPYTINELLGFEQSSKVLFILNQIPGEISMQKYARNILSEEPISNIFENIFA